MLDAVEHRGETFTVVRRGRAIATIAAAHRTTLSELRDFSRRIVSDDLVMLSAHVFQAGADQAHEAMLGFTQL
jgi:antitoxin (DNA-binding transcriptional repressor) of toxin-antitoxin stability system